MAYEESLKSITLNADASLAVYTGVAGAPGSPTPNYGKQYRFVKVTGAHQVGATVAGDPAVGVLQSKPQVAGQAATVGIFGVSNVMAGAAFAAGVELQSDANGLAVLKSTGVAVAISLDAATGANTIVPALLKV